MKLNRVKIRIPSALLSFSLVGLALSVIMNTPSLKLVVGETPLVNLAGISLLMAAAVFRVLHLGFVKVRRYSAYFLGMLALVGAYIIFPELLFLRDPAHLYSYESLRYLYLIVTFALVAFTVQPGDLKPFLTLQVGWAFLLTILYLTGAVTYSQELGQHYNTVALPIVLGGLVLLGYMLGANDISVFRYVSLLLLLSVFVVGLLHLHGRSALVFSALILIGTLIWRGGGIRDRMRTVTVVGTGIIGAFLVIRQAVQWLDLRFSHLLFRRLEALAPSGGEEIRVSIYATTIEKALEAPFGHGFGAFPEVVGLNYPHNLFLEFLFSGGVIPFLIVVSAFGIIGWHALQRLRVAVDVETIQVLFVFAYMFLTFMVSYSLSDSYLLFTALAIALPAIYEAAATRPSSAPRIAQ